jgi:hypothetical protein
VRERGIPVTDGGRKENDFTTKAAGAAPGEHIGWCAGEEFLEFLGEFASEDNLEVGVNLRQLFEQTCDSVRRFVKNPGAGDLFEPNQLFAALA